MGLTSHCQSPCYVFILLLESAMFNEVMGPVIHYSRMSCPTRNRSTVSSLERTKAMSDVVEAWDLQLRFEGGQSILLHQQSGRRNTKKGSPIASADFRTHHLLHFSTTSKFLFVQHQIHVEPYSKMTKGKKYPALSV
jgi:hypothetical protein